VTSSPGSTAGHAGPVGPVAVIVPTYNERDNIEIIASRVRGAVPDAHLLVVDDNSPDGTGEIADKLASKDPQIHVLHRAGKAGLGAAYVAGFRWALERGYGAMVEPARISCSGHATCPAGPCSTGPGRASCCPAPATLTPG